MDQPTDSEERLFSAKDLQRWRWQINGTPGIEPPQAVIFCLQPELLQYARRHHPLKPVKGLFGDCFLLKSKQNRMALAGKFGLGAPAMAILTEEYAAFGVHRFLSIGIAGSLQPELHTGDVVVCERAIRGEGTSSHYLPPSPFVEADREMIRGLCDSLSSHGIRSYSGTTWTTDAPYRETREKADIYRKQGVLTVDMEAAALFAAGQSLHTQAVSVFVIGDQLLAEGWKPPARMADINKSLNTVLEAAISWLTGDKS